MNCWKTDIQLWVVLRFNAFAFMVFYTTFEHSILVAYLQPKNRSEWSTHEVSQNGTISLFIARNLNFDGLESIEVWNNLTNWKKISNYLFHFYSSVHEQTRWPNARHITSLWKKFIESEAIQLTRNKYSSKNTRKVEKGITENMPSFSFCVDGKNFFATFTMIASTALFLKRLHLRWKCL